MGGGIGAGGMAFASQQMRRLQRELDSYLNKRACARAARFKSSRRCGKNSYVPPNYHAEFECYWLCQDCGFISWDEKKTCPACARTAVVNLTDDVVARRIAMAEEFNRQKSPSWVKIGLGVGLALLELVVICLFSWSIWVILICGVLYIPVYALSLRSATVVLLKLCRPTPSRWHFPLVDHKSKYYATVKKTGAVKEYDDGSTLISPITGTRCIAYQVIAVFDIPGDARPPQSVLEESRNISFEVDGIKIEADKVFLVTPLMPVASEMLSEEFDIDRFLRIRGLFQHDGTFELFESCLTDGDHVDVKVDETCGIAQVYY